MKKNGYITVNGEKILIVTSYEKNKTVLQKRESGGDGLHFTSEEGLFKSNQTALERLKQGKEVIL